jgi:tRNA A-37 threonylcarbamoyl transferase component Bud32
MLDDPTRLDSLGWEAVKKALNQRVVVTETRFVPSRVNRVWIVETDVHPVVVKRFLSGKCGNEFESLLLARGAGVSVPYPLASHGDYLVMEYLPGEGCDVLINKMFSWKAAEAIGRWLAVFHRKLSTDFGTRIRRDAVLANFLVSDGIVYGIDLEDSAIGDPMDDVGQLGASILGSEPFFTPIKFDLCTRMLRAYEEVAKSEVFELSRMYIARHLLLDARQKPLFRRTLVDAAKSLETKWPNLA